MEEKAYKMAEVLAMLGDDYTKGKVHRIINKFTDHIRITGSGQNTRYPESSVAIIKTIISMLEQGKGEAEIQKVLEEPVFISAEDPSKKPGKGEKVKKEGELEKHKNAVQILKKINTIEAELHSLKQMLLSGL